MAERDETTGDIQPASPARLDRVGANLRRVYEESANQPLPEAFEELLQRLR